MGENNSKGNNWQRIPKIYKQLIQLNTRKAKNPIRKWERHLKRHFSKEDIQMANKPMRRYSASLITTAAAAKSLQSCLILCNPIDSSPPGSTIPGILQARTLEKCKPKPHEIPPARMAIIKKSINNKCWRGCGEKGTLLHCWWECKLIQPLWKTVWRFL